MPNSTRQLKLLCLLLASLAFCGVAASAAQAGEFGINGTAFALLVPPLPEESISGNSGAGKLLVPGLSLTIACTSSDISGKVFRGGTALVTALFLGCSVEGNKFCKVYPTAADKFAKTNAGDITALAKGPILLHNSLHFILFEEDSAVLSTVFYSSASEGCGLLSGETITGKTVVELTDLLVNKPEHQFEQLHEAEIKALFPSDTIKYGNQAAWLDGGIGGVHLSGAAHLNANWSGE
jgi:hypothetical protein